MILYFFKFQSLTKRIKLTSSVQERITCTIHNIRISIDFVPLFSDQLSGASHIPHSDQQYFAADSKSSRVRQQGVAGDLARHRAMHSLSVLTPTVADSMAHKKSDFTYTNQSFKKIIIIIYRMKQRNK